MPISINTQAYIFLYSVMGGMFIAFIYDVFRIKRKTIKTHSVVIYFEDMIYWIIVALVMFAVVYYSNEGEIRGYIFIGTAIGVALYVSLFSRIVVNFSLAIIMIVCRTIKTVWNIVSLPFRIIFVFLRVPAGFLLKGLIKAGRTVRRIGRNRMAKAAIWGRVLKNLRKKI